jgi:hypothetical protein
MKRTRHTLEQVINQLRWPILQGRAASALNSGVNDRRGCLFGVLRALSTETPRRASSPVSVSAETAQAQ